MARSPTFAIAPPRALLDRRPGRRRAAARGLRRRARVRHAAARGRAGRARSASPGPPSARRSACWSPRAWPPASPTAASPSPPPRPTRCATSAAPGACSRAPAYAAGRQRRRRGRARPCATRWPRTSRPRPPSGASYQRPQRAPPRLPPLAGRPDRVTAAGGDGEQLSAELRLALAQVDRIRPQRPDQAESHPRWCELLESGDVDDDRRRARATPRRRRDRDPGAAPPARTRLTDASAHEAR